MAQTLDLGSFRRLMRREPLTKQRTRWVTVRAMQYIDTSFPAGTMVDEIDPDDLSRSDADSFWRAVRRDDRVNADQAGQVGRLVPVQAGDRARWMRAGADIQIPQPTLQLVEAPSAAESQSRPAPRGQRSRRV